MTHDASRRRYLCSYTFEDGSYVELIVSGPVRTEIALEMVLRLARVKQEELAETSKGETTP